MQIMRLEIILYFYITMRTSNTLTAAQEQATYIDSLPCII